MGLGESIKGFFTTGAKQLANTNRAFYKRSLYLIVTSRSLPVPEREDSIQAARLQGVFNAIQLALDLGTLVSKNSNDAREGFHAANTILQKYIEEFLPGPQFQSANDGFENSVKEDIWAENALENFSEKLKKKWESIKGFPKRTMDICFWGAIPASKLKGSMSLQYNMNRVPYQIIIEETANLDELLHRAMEFATMKNYDQRQPLKELRSLELGLYPQFYRIYPDDEESIRRGKMVSLQPWFTVAELKLSSNQPLHVLSNRNLIGDPNARFDSFYERSMDEKYSNAWPFVDTSGKRIGNSLAVRNRTPSHSISILTGVQMPKAKPYHPPQAYPPYSHLLNVPSSSTLINPSTSSRTTLAPSQAQSSWTTEVTTIDKPALPALPMQERQIPKIDSKSPPSATSSPPRQDGGKQTSQRTPSNENEQRAGTGSHGSARAPLSNPSDVSLSRPGTQTPNSEASTSEPGSSPRVRPAFGADKTRKMAMEHKWENLNVKEPPKKGFFSRLFGL